MPNTHVQSMIEIARVDGSATRIEAKLYKNYEVFVCVITWPEEFQDLVLGIALPLRKPLSPLYYLEIADRVLSLELPPEVRNFSAADQWFRAHFDNVLEILQPNWHLYTRRGTGLYMQQALDEPVLVIRLVVDDAWVNGNERLHYFLAVLNQSPLCEAGTARYLGDGSIEVRLSQAGLAEKQEKLVIQLAQLYDK